MIDRLEIRKTALNQGWTVTALEDAVPDRTQFAHPQRGHLTVYWTGSIRVHAFDHRIGSESVSVGRLGRHKRERVLAILEGK